MAAALRLVTLLVCASIASAQLFPFASLQEYFEHEARRGPGADAQVAAESGHVAVAAAATQVPPPSNSSTTELPAASTTDGDGDGDERVQAAQESARVDSVLHNPGLAYDGLTPAVVLTPPAVDAPRPVDYVAAVAPREDAGGAAAAVLRALSPLPTFGGQRNAPADEPPEHSLLAAQSFGGEGSAQAPASPTYAALATPTFDIQKIVQPAASAAYASPIVPTFDGQKSAQHFPPPAYTSLVIPTFGSHRSAQPTASAEYASPAIPVYHDRQNTQTGALPVYSSPQPAPNPYLTIPKLALKAVPFNSYPYPQQTGMPQLHEAFTPLETQATFKPLKLYKNTPLYPKKYRPELEQAKLAAPTPSVGGLTSKKTHFPKEDYPLVKQQKQNAHNIAVTNEAASFHKKVAPAVQATANVERKKNVSSAKPPAPPATKLSPSVEQSAAASGFSPSTDSAGEGTGFVNHHNAVAAGLGPGHERIEFQMYGHHGPHSYKFGFDTGKGHNRQFRYEERDPHGHVKGHYGFYNKDGKLQVVSYTAHPEHGFHANGNFGKHAI